MGKNFLSQMFKPIKSAGKWVVHAAEDTFDFTKQTVSNGVKLGGKAGSSLLHFADKQTSKISDVLTNPTLLIVVGVAIVAIVVLK